MPGITRYLAEVLPETCLCDGKVRKGGRQVHFLLAFIFDVLDFGDRPVQLDGRISIKIQAFGDRVTGIRVVAKQ